MEKREGSIERARAHFSSRFFSSNRHSLLLPSTMATSFSLFPYPQRGTCGVLILLDVPTVPGGLSCPKSLVKVEPRLPFPRLPWDLFLLIFSQCDIATLAQLGRVSHDFLVAVTRPLYGRIEIASVIALEVLFCERPETSPGRINPYLSLSQTQTLVLDFTSLLSPPPSPSNLSFDRILKTDPLPLNLLSITSRFDQHPYLDPIYSSLLPRLNPTRFNFTVSERPFTASSWLGLGVPPLLSWNRIQILEFKGVIPFSFHGGIGGLPSPSLGRRRVVRLHVSTLFFQRHEDVDLLLRALFRNGIVVGLEFMQDASIMLLVRSEKERRGTEVAIERLEKTKRLFSVVEFER
ncbi:hypothetical protein BDY24DRAFT_389447 [Mrakia frigida]|uniref:uncharacterized protein n=1 Tax=Mrakia frigida TaxID=29902 RepID=UPI003FCC0C0F